MTTVVTDTATAPSPRSTWRLVAFLAATLVLGFVFQTKTAPSAGDALDPSWRPCSATTSSKAGSSAWTTSSSYGVLGYFVATDAPYIPSLYGISLIVRLLLGIGAAAVLLAALRAVRPWPLQVIGLAALVALAPFQRELVYLAAVGLFPAAVAAARRVTLPVLALAGLFLVCVALGKHTILFAGTVSLACTLAIVAHRRGARTALAPLLIFAAEFFGIWIAAFQHPRNLPAYFIGAWDVVRGLRGRHGGRAGAGRAPLAHGRDGNRAGPRLLRRHRRPAARPPRLRRRVRGDRDPRDRRPRDQARGVTRADDGHRVVANGILFLLALAATRGLRRSRTSSAAPRSRARRSGSSPPRRTSGIRSKASRTSSGPT